MEELKKNWLEALKKTQVKKLSLQLDSQFIGQRDRLQKNIAQLPEAEQSAINGLGVEFILHNDIKVMRAVNSGSFARAATRNIFMSKSEVGDFETVWEENFHLLIAYSTSKKMPSKETLAQWQNEHPGVLQLLEDIRKKAVPESGYYDSLSKGEIPLDAIWEELVVDCARYQRLHDVSAKEMQQQFGMVWDITRHVQQDIESLASVRADPAFRIRLDTLSEARGVGSILGLQK